MRNPEKGLSSLRRGRRSANGSNYFITICLEPGAQGLDEPAVYASCCHVIQQLEFERLIESYSFVIMPDHLHMLFRLLNNSKLEKTIRLFKGRMSPAIRKAGLSWQRGYYDRLLRNVDPIDVVLRYMLFNPYRKGLLKQDEKWPYWHCSNTAARWMSNEGREELPLPNWLA